MRSLNIKYIPELDQLRGLAALLVLYFHAIAGSPVVGQYMAFAAGPVPIADNPLKLIIANGFTGVALFFVISGFLFTWGALQQDSLNWRKFYFNRILRIFPLYILLLLVVFAVGRGQVTFPELLQSLVGFGNLTETHGDFAIVLWTISIELQFYMLFPFLLSLLRRRGVRYIGGLIAVLVVIRGIIWLDQLNLHDPVYWTLIGRLDQFLVGMVLAWLVHHRGWLQSLEKPFPKPKWHNLAKPLAGLALTSLTLLGLLWAYTASGWKYGNSALLIVWPTLEATAWAGVGLFYVAIARQLRSGLFKAIQYLGMVSYSFYLLHYPIARAVHNANLELVIPGHRFASGLATATLEIFPLALGVAILTYYVIEKPPLDLRRQYTTFSGPKPPIPSASGSDS